MFIFDYLIWSPDPDIFTLPLSFIGLSDRPVRWYGLLFALGFILSQQVLYRIYRTDGQNPKDVDILTTYMVIATILGARLGHCLFYNPGHYLSNPIEILKVWEGGLASHGGAIGILIALWLYANYDIRAKLLGGLIPYSFSAKKIVRQGQSYFWVLDRMVIVVALTGALIRTGNFMNSEMEGTLTGSGTGVVYAAATEEALMRMDGRIESVDFQKGGSMESSSADQVPITAVITYQRGVRIDENRDIRYIQNSLQRVLLSHGEIQEHIDFNDQGRLNYAINNEGRRSTIKIHGIGMVRHAAQLYEAGYCILIMLILLWIWKNKRNSLPEGFSFGLFMMMLWSLRFVDEFFKMNQEDFEADLSLNMGQWLSIPMFLLGLVVMLWSLKNGVKTEKG